MHQGRVPPSSRLCSHHSRPNESTVFEVRVVAFVCSVMVKREDSSSIDDDNENEESNCCLNLGSS